MLISFSVVGKGRRWGSGRRLPGRQLGSCHSSQPWRHRRRHHPGKLLPLTTSGRCFSSLLADDERGKLKKKKKKPKPKRKRQSELMELITLTKFKWGERRFLAGRYLSSARVEPTNKNKDGWDEPVDATTQITIWSWRLLSVSLSMLQKSVKDLWRMSNRVVVLLTKQ